MIEKEGKKERERDIGNENKQAIIHPIPLLLLSSPLKVAVLFFYQCRHEGGKDDDRVEKRGEGEKW